MNTRLIEGPATVDTTPRALIAGDLHLCVTESEVARMPVKGSYRIDAEGMQEPLQIFWNAEGRVLNREAGSTDIEFDMRGSRAGQMRVHVVTAQVMERDGWRCIVSAVFVKILVM